MTIEYKSLSDTPIEDVHACFVEAFSDYQIKINMSLTEYQHMLKRRGVYQPLSFGAFDGEKLIGIVINGIGDWEGEKTAYDAGTGLIKKYRGKGIGKALFAKSLPVLKAEGFEQYLLEVIQTNTPAVELYRKAGFETVREFDCLRIKKEKLLASPAPESECEIVEMLRTPNWKYLKKFWDFKPSWQNSIASIDRVPEAFNLFEARVNGKQAGYGIIETQSGDIPQLAVSKDHRKKGIGRALLHRLATVCLADRLSAINIDMDCKMSISFWKGQGFESVATQFEMIYPLELPKNNV